MSLDPLDTVRVGIVGPSWWVNYWHLAALQTHPNVEVVAVSGGAERDPDEVKAKYGANALYFTNYEEMMDTVPMDGVIVCTPNYLHHPVTMAALKRDLHVTCEKPIALNAEQAFEMADTASKRNLIGMSNFPYRDNPAVQAFRKLIDADYVGDILHVSGSYHGGFGLRRNPNWRSLRARSGAGILGDLGSHLIDLVRYITGEEFSAVSGNMITTLWDADGDLDRILHSENPDVGERNDDSCTFLAELTSGAQAVLHTSWVAHQGAGIQQQEIEVYGTEGRLHLIASHRGVSLRGLHAGNPNWETIEVEGVVTVEAANGTEEEDFFRPGRHTPTNTTYRWLEAIRNDETTVEPSLWDGYYAQEVIDAVILSSAERRWVLISEVSEGKPDEYSD